MSHNISPTMTLLPGGPDDSYAVFQVFKSSLADLNTRLGVAPATGHPKRNNTTVCGRSGSPSTNIWRSSRSFSACPKRSPGDWDGPCWRGYSRPAVERLLQRGFRLDSFVAIWMSDEPFACMKDYIVTSPPFSL